MLRSHVKAICGAAALAAAVLLSTQSFAYTCFNPAICKAVCGSTTCGSLKASNADIKRLDTKKAMTLSSGANKKPSGVKPYTCSNPAICIAVCGKKTCG